MFKYCINELLVNLHEDACKNIVLCFTNSRVTWFQPGETLPVLEKLLHENGQHIALNSDTLYFKDNETAWYLAALKRGVTYSARNLDLSQSSKESQKECMRLINHFKDVKRHLVHSALSVISCRWAITAHLRSLGDVSITLQEHIDEIIKQSNTLSTKDKDKLVITTIYEESIRLQNA